jgi:tetratricopeptide (TPR) repeat protein
VLERPAKDIALSRVNRANMLRNLGRFVEAKVELEDCLHLFQNDPARRAITLGSLADLCSEQSDVLQAITQQRRALTICGQLPDLSDCAISHHNLANSLMRSGTPSVLTESPLHQLTALMYRLIAGLRQDLQAHCGAEKVYVIAHSMDNRGLLRALQRIAAQAQTLGQVKFGQIFLAAPDVARDLFLDLARLYPAHAERTTLYASNGDLPVHLSAHRGSEHRHGGRAGLRYRSAGPLLLRPGRGVAA